MIPRWFLYLQGFAMVVMGVSLLALRPRRREDPFVRRWVHAGTLWALCCLAVGVALLAMALGYWSWPPAPRLAPPQQPQQQHLRPI
jgi:hypothetical protein